MQLHHLEVAMRTTLDLDDDVLASAKEIALREKKTAGQVLSELARKGLTQGDRGSARSKATAFGFTPFAARGSVVTNELIRKLRDESDE
jgi:Arc/MetJ family transcription regulator